MEITKENGIKKKSVSLGVAVRGGLEATENIFDTYRLTDSIIIMEVFPDVLQRAMLLYKIHHHPLLKQVPFKRFTHIN